ncbi:MAG: hypothetical protein GY950_32905 [bacterium]|nr:hypothetical protein [bacterium]
MKKYLILIILLAVWGTRLYPQKQIKYYRVDSVKTIKGKIVTITNEKSYQKKDFTVIYLEEKKSRQIYRVEVSPEWFFNMDLMKGSNIEVTGSSSRVGENPQMMTRSIAFQGELHQFRDKYGFPLWRGKRKYIKGIRKGRIRRRGKH